VEKRTAMQAVRTARQAVKKRTAMQKVKKRTATQAVKAKRGRLGRQ